MEIKSCEQYVVSRLMELEDEVDKYDSLVKECTDTIEKLQEQLNYVGQFFSIRKFTPVDTPEHYIDFDNVWNKSKPEDFDKLCEIFGLTIPEDDDSEEF